LEQAVVQAILKHYPFPPCIAWRLLLQSQTETRAKAMAAIHFVSHPLTHEKQNRESETRCKNMMT
jgi:hypothetical protein